MSRDGRIEGLEPRVLHLLRAFFYTQKPGRALHDELLIGIIIVRALSITKPYWKYYNLLPTPSSISADSATIELEGFG